jgi:hypothetical protein
MVQLYPNLITAPENISTFLTEGEPDDSTTPSIGGNGIKWVKISDNPNSSEENEPETIYTAVHHASRAVKPSRARLTLHRCLLTALNERTEWGQVFILDSLAKYIPKDGREAEGIIIEWVSPRLYSMSTPGTLPLLVHKSQVLTVWIPSPNSGVKKSFHFAFFFFCLISHKTK